MKYYFIESRNGDEFETELSAQTDEDAIEEAEELFDSLSKYDRKRTERAYVCLASVDYNRLICREEEKIVATIK